MGQGNIFTTSLNLTQVDIDTVDAAPSGVTKLVAGDDGKAYLVNEQGNKTEQINASNPIFSTLGLLRPVVTKQPENITGSVGQSLALECLGGILPNTHLNLTYQWELSADLGVSYNNITGATNPTIPFNPAFSTNNGLYRCRLTNEFGFEYTDAASLTVTVDPVGLFGETDRGVIWDLDRMDHLFQLSVQTPVAAHGDPVGLVVSRTRGGLDNLGPELRSGGTALVNGTATESTYNTSTGVAQITRVDINNLSWIEFNGLEVGRFYRLQITHASGPNLVLRRDSPTASVVAGSVFTDTVVFLATLPTLFISCGTGTVNFTIESLRMLPNTSQMIQTTEVNRPRYARKPKTEIRNILTRSEDFANAAWTKNQSSISGNFLTDNATNNAHFISQIPPTGTGQTETLTVWAKAGSLNWLGLFIDGVTAFFNLSNGTIGTVGAGGTASIALEPDGFYRCRMTRTRVNSSTTFRIYVTNADNTFVYLGTGTGTIELQKSQFEVAANSTPYQKVTNQWDVTEVGVPSINYLSFNGVNSCLQSAVPINFSNADAMTICVGARKLTDDSQRSLIELGASVDSNNGTFQLTAPNGASTSYAMRSRGTNTVTAEATGFAQPDTAILTGQIDISSDLLTLRRNGSQVATSSSDQGSGNFANATLFIGARNNASDRFLGHLYSGFIINKILDPAVLEIYESEWVAAKSGVDL